MHASYPKPGTIISTMASFDTNVGMGGGQRVGDRATEIMTDHDRFFQPEVLEELPDILGHRALVVPAHWALKSPTPRISGAITRCFWASAGMTLRFHSYQVWANR